MMAIVEQGARARDNAEGWGSLVRRLAPYVHAVLVRAYRLPEQEAQEIFQDVFARTWARMDELRDDGAVRRWIMALTRQLAQEARQDLAGDDGPPSAAVLRELDDALAVSEAIRHLPVTQRDVAVRRWLDGQDREAIAAALGLSVQTVTAQLEGARRHVQQELEREAADARRQE